MVNVLLNVLGVMGVVLIMGLVLLFSFIIADMLSGSRLGDWVTEVQLKSPRRALADHKQAKIERDAKALQEVLRQERQASLVYRQDKALNRAREAKNWTREFENAGGEKSEILADEAIVSAYRKYLSSPYSDQIRFEEMAAEYNLSSQQIWGLEK